MDRLIDKKINRQRRARRVRSQVHGTSERPRLTVHISNQHVTAQIVDDEKGRTLAYASSIGANATGPISQKAGSVGVEIAQTAKKAKIKKVVFDRSHRKYHQRLKALADAARKGGLEF